MNQEYVEIDQAVFYEKVAESFVMAKRQFNKMAEVFARLSVIFPKPPERSWWDEEHYEEHRVIPGVIRFNVPLDCPQCGMRAVHISNYTILCYQCNWKRERG